MTRKPKEPISSRIQRRTGHPKLKGKAPGELVHIGKATDAIVRIEKFVYNPTDVDCISNLAIHECSSILNGKNYWYNVDGIHNTQLIASLGEVFAIDPLILEDLVNADQRPKAEVIDDQLFVTAKMASLMPDGSIDMEQVSFVLMGKTLLSFQERPGDVFEPVRQRLMKENSRVRSKEADYLLFALMDVIIDHYFLLIDHLTEELEKMDDEVLKLPDESILVRLQDNRRRIAQLKKVIAPMRESVSRLIIETSIIQEDTQKYFRDLYDHTIHIAESLDSLRDFNVGIKEMYVNGISLQMNKVMQVLTIISTIFIPLTFIAGVYGMNFAHMPELAWKYSYAVVWGVMLLIGLLLILYFRKKRWL